MKFTGLNIEKFSKWLVSHGAEILPNTNEYESIRFKGKEVGVLYTSGKVGNGYTAKAIMAYKHNMAWIDGRPLRTGRKDSYKKEKIKLLKRDGDKCFYCGERLMEDITLEHIIPLVSGGKNTIGNMVLAHEKCNQEAGNLSVYQKVELAIKKRNKCQILEQ